MRTISLLVSLPLAVSAGFWGVGRNQQSAFVHVPTSRLPSSTVVQQQQQQSQPRVAALESSSSRSRRDLARMWMSEEVEAAPVVAEAETEAAAEPAAAEDGGADKKKKEKRTPLSDLAAGQELTGKVKGIKDFGIFVDIGAESDGLVHISQMSATFVSNPNDLAKVGDVVNVRVLTVDANKRQIALTMKTAAESAAPRPKGRGPKRERAPRDDDADDDEEDAGEDALASAPVGDKDVSAFKDYDPKKFLDGTVASVQAYGAFIRIDDAELDGLLPTGDMDGKLESGQRVKVRITDVDTERNRITLSNLPLLRGKRTRFALNKEDTDDLAIIAGRSGLYASELPEIFEGADDDADWEEAFSFKGFGDDAGMEGAVPEVEDVPEAVFGEEPEEDDEEFSMGSINAFRSPAYKKEKGLMVDDDDEDAEAEFKYGGEAYFPEDEDEDDGSGMAGYSKAYDTQIPQLNEDELKALIRKAQGTRRNVTEEWADEEAEEKEYMTLTLVNSKKKGQSLMMKQVNSASAETAIKKPRMPIYFSKKLSAVKQVELLEELEKLVNDDPLALSK